MIFEIGERLFEFLITMAYLSILCYATTRILVVLIMSGKIK